MSKKERETWMLQRIEEWKAEKEAEKQAILAGAKEKRAQLARERAELMAKDNSEQEIRRDLLQKTCDLFQIGYISYLETSSLKWQQYLRCDGLPDPRVVTQMNTYIHIWQNQINCDPDELNKRCIETLPDLSHFLACGFCLQATNLNLIPIQLSCQQMLEMLEEFVANSRQYTALQAQSYNEVRLALREQLSNAIQLASYTLLRDLEKYLKFQSIKLAMYEREFKGLRLNIWVAVQMPTRRPRPQEPDPEPVELSFPAMKVALKLPKIIDGSRVCVRAARSMIDLLSESTRTFHLAGDMPNRYLDLFIFNVKEHVETYKLKKEYDDIRNKFYKETGQKIRELENFLKANPICGGVLNLDLLITPPQPKRMRGAITLTARE
ncbi:unnamed protein product [Diatraea saccharalis]|uniref:IC97/Casc1 N-terminal domain-containing protein n=1 Tax=Diatraea saccharalis TaxID=40085 RepID=A0A9N9RE71_9NEOP|nr:unnamed protein product [Diatraea saccharalis]